MPFINILTFFILTASIIVLFVKLGVQLRDVLGVEGSVYDNNALKSILLLAYALGGSIISFMLIFLAGASIWTSDEGTWILPEFLFNVMHLFN